MMLLDLVSSVRFEEKCQMDLNVPSVQIKKMIGDKK